MHMPLKQAVCDAVHAIYCDAYWREMEERGHGPQAGQELTTTTTHQPDDVLYPYGCHWLGQIKVGWGFDAAIVFYHMWNCKRRETEQQPVPLEVQKKWLYELFMACAGHGVGLHDDQDTEDRMIGAANTLLRHLPIEKREFNPSPVHIDTETLNNLAHVAVDERLNDDPSYQPTNEDGSPNINYILLKDPRGNKNGAAMGDRDKTNCDNPMLHVQQVDFVDGDYGPDGTYWGGVGKLGGIWCGFNEINRIYVRAHTTYEAQRKIAAKYDWVKFVSPAE